MESSPLGAMSGYAFGNPTYQGTTGPGQVGLAKRNPTPGGRFDGCQVMDMSPLPFDRTGGPPGGRPGVRPADEPPSRQAAHPPAPPATATCRALQCPTPPPPSSTSPPLNPFSARGRSRCSGPPPLPPRSGGVRSRPSSGTATRAPSIRSTRARRRSRACPHSRASRTFRAPSTSRSAPSRPAR